MFYIYFFVHRIQTLHPVSHLIHPRCPKGLNLCQISLAVDSKPITVAPPVHPNRFVVFDILPTSIHFSGRKRSYGIMMQLQRLR